MDEWFYDIINLFDDPADNILVQRHLARQTQLNKDFFFNWAAFHVSVTGTF